ncbi:IS110 family transposase [Streptomyces sp. FxanaC1]|uniref:IS110 family transposase n=1 Tax=unclassified Streptomyces TaxID=2593676 RepID=UPI001F422B54|nr:IS110 family transposase [Streptomyces sp. FxanaC1]
MDEVVLGVDTHRDVHVAAGLSTLGAGHGHRALSCHDGGYCELWEWASQLGAVHRAGVEGSGSYGAALSRYLLARRVEVFEVHRPDRSVRRRRGKSDPVDAQEAARAVLSGHARSQAKSGDGPVQCARLFKLAKDSAVKARTQAINQLKAILVTADPDLREQLAGLKTPALVRTCAQFDDREDDDGVKDAAGQATRIALGLLGQRIDQLTRQIRDLERRLTGLVERHFPQMLVPVGIGPDSAATLLITMGDNPERLCSEASFAALCGVSPVEYSSGRQRHHRLNRGGDRRANAALYRIVQTRLRFDARTRNYYERRTAEGKTRREIIRCLKRYAAREVFNLVRSGIGPSEVA